MLPQPATQEHDPAARLVSLFLTVQTAGHQVWHAAVCADQGHHPEASAALADAWAALDRARPDADAVALALALRTPAAGGAR